MSLRLLLLAAVLLATLPACPAKQSDELAAARALYEAAKPREARKRAEALAGRPIAERAVVEDLAELLIQVGAPKRAARLLTGQPDLTVRGRNLLAWARLGEKDRTRAATVLSALLESGEANARTHQLQAYLEMEGARFREARAQAEKAVELSPEDVRGWVAVALAVAGGGDRADGIDRLRAAVRRFPDSREARRALATLLYARDAKPATLTEVVELLGPVVKAHPQDREAREMRGTALRKLHRDVEAEQCWEGICADWPDAAGAWSELGMARLGRGRWKEAVEALEKARDLARDVPILMNLANGYLALSEVMPDWKPWVEKARAVFQGLAARIPEEPMVYVGLGRCLVKLDPTSDPLCQQAIAEYRKALALDPTCFPAHLNIALLYYELWMTKKSPRGEGYRLAKEHFERANELVPATEWEPHARAAWEEIR